MNGPGTRSARPRAHPAEQHRAEHHVITARHRRQHPRPHQVEQRGRRHPKQPGPVPQPARQPARPAPAGLADAAAVPAGIRQPERRRRLGHIAQQRRRRTPRAPPGAIPSRAWATKSRNGTGSGSRSAAPGQQRRDLGQHHVHPGVVQDQVMDLDQRQPPPRPRLRRHRAPPAAAPAAGPSAAPGRRQQPRPVRGPVPASPAGSSISVTGSRACRHTTWTGSRSPSHATEVR